IFIDGLKDVEHYSNSHFSNSFSELTATQQIEVVGHFRDEGKNYSGTIGKIKNKFAGKSFFHILKEYSTIAFCTSKNGATKTLAYDFIPGKFEPCLQMTPGQKSWATK
ncbi:MAG TPA: gluconate 2-dehydrogenase subunit 3 family protein, partial [Chitinophagaceae bacterium]|nr:gluconate 2-dehydrogenase subunit 3 family protein [Chitinophagaceae bacterium]